MSCNFGFTIEAAGLLSVKLIISNKFLCVGYFDDFSPFRYKDVARYFHTSTVSMMLIMFL